MSDKTLYIAGSVLKKAKLTIGLEVDLTSFAEGCDGLIPVFKSREDAEKFTGEEGVVTEITVGFSRRVK